MCMSNLDINVYKLKERQMSNNKQSSVEWLDEKLSGLHFEYLTGEITNSEFNERKKVIMAEAKAMHNDEITKSMNVAFIDAMKMRDENYKSPYEDWEQYYAETFGE
jgi:hypothetical protein